MVNNARTQTECLYQQVGVGVVRMLDTPNIQCQFETLVYLFSRRQHLIIQDCYVVIIDVYQNKYVVYYYLSGMGVV